jgi:GNAT superfamily N-acetyltransferase
MSSPDIVILSEPDASPSDIEAVRRGLERFNRAFLGDERHRPLNLLVRDTSGTIVGGLLGDMYFNWLLIEVLWVSEPLRGQGVGARLLAMAEEEARRYGCDHAHLDTFDFQSPDFYLKRGYVEFGKLGPYPGGHVRHYLKKSLVGPRG